MHVTGFGWAAVLAEDFEETLKFYTEVLGLSLAYQDEVKVAAYFRLPSGQLLEVYGPSNRQRKDKYRWFNGPALGFNVEDVGLARQEMVARGVRFITEVETWQDDAWAMFIGPEDWLFQIERPTPHYPGKSGKIMGFSWAGVVVQDFTRAIAFFEKVMEMPISRRDDESELAQFSLPAGHVFEVFGPNNNWSQLMSHTTIAFEVDDVWQTRAGMEEMGVEFVSDVQVTSIGEAFTYFRGPDGYLYEIWKPVKPSDS